MQYITYETDRLLIRPTQVEDAGFILELLNTPKWIEFIGDRKVYTQEEAKAYIEIKMLPQLKRLGYSNNTIILKETNEKIGCCGLYDREGVEGVDIGFAFLPDFEGQGYGYECSKKLIDQAMSDWGITKVSAITSKHNLASQKLLLKLGLTLEGEVTLPNETEVLFLFTIIL